MWIVIITISYLLSQKCSAIHLIDLPTPVQTPVQKHESVEAGSDERNSRRQWQQEHIPNSNHQESRQYVFRQHADKPGDDAKDLDIKTKIATLVSQTVHDTQKKVESIKNLKERNREHAPYKIGFILSMIKKARDVLNELFNVAVKHRDEWKALEQLKIFELIVHTNVDTTNLVRQMVEIHVQHMNTTSSPNNSKRRVVLL